MEFGLLGSLEVRFGGSLVEIRPGLPRTILTLLLLRRGEVVTSGYLIETLWEINPPLNPANALQTQIVYLRKRFATQSSTPVIVTRPGGYSLDVERWTIDAHRFEDAVTAAMHVDQHDNAALRDGLASLDQALELWRGRALADVTDHEFALGEITRLEELRIVAIEVRTDMALALGQHRSLGAELAALITEHPLRERLHYQLMLSLYRSGRQADALRAYANARRLLIDELGIEPSSELRELEQRILEQDPTLDAAVDVTNPHQSAGSEPLPPPSRSRRGGRLPAALSDLIGRQIELDRISTLLGRSRVVTLTGPAGAGKSRLAIETARRCASPDEVWFVDLAPAHDSHSVAAAVAQSLNLTLLADEDASASIAAALSRTRGLLLLDTCEHVVDAVAVLVSQIVAETDDIQILATSRRALKIRSELGWPVPPLAVPPDDSDDLADLERYPAVALFVERATAVRPDFHLTTEIATDVAALCRSLDGLPLAIELAAARVDVLSPRAIAERLSRRFDILIDGGLDVAPRQRSLRGAIEWSVDLLSEDEHRFFARLSVFATSFDLQAASVISGESEERALELMTSLVRQSMVVIIVEHDRYLLLHTLKAYGTELLSNLDGDETRDRHTSHYLAMAEEADRGLRGPEQLVWLAKLRIERSNLFEALEWLLVTDRGAAAARMVSALRWFFTLEGRLGEAERYMHRVLQTTDLPRPFRARVLGGLALTTVSARQWNRAETFALDCVAEARTVGDQTETAFGLSMLALAQCALGDVDVSERNFAEALRLYTATGDSLNVAFVRVLRVRNIIERGDDRVADVATAIEAARATGDSHLVGVALRLAAHVSLQVDDAPQAETRALEALDNAEMFGSAEAILGASYVLGIALDRNGKPEMARRVYLRALHLAVTTGHYASTCEAIEGLAALTMQQGNLDDALRLIDAVDAKRAQLGIPRRRDESDLLADIRSAAGSATQPVRHDSFDRIIDELLDAPLARPLLALTTTSSSPHDVLVREP